jgi:hypothetical protein
MFAIALNRRRNCSVAVFRESPTSACSSIFTRDRLAIPAYRFAEMPGREIRRQVLSTPAEVGLGSEEQSASSTARGHAALLAGGGDPLAARSATPDGYCPGR